jgi:hypothetical protein
LRFLGLDRDPRVFFRRLAVSRRRVEAFAFDPTGFAGVFARPFGEAFALGFALRFAGGRGGRGERARDGVASATTVGPEVSAAAASGTASGSERAWRASVHEGGLSSTAAWAA